MATPTRDHHGPIETMKTVGISLMAGVFIGYFAMHAHDVTPIQTAASAQVAPSPK